MLVIYSFHFNCFLEACLNAYVDSDVVFDFLLHCRKIETSRNPREPFDLSLDCDRFDVENCEPVAVDLCLVSFDLND